MAVWKAFGMNLHIKDSRLWIDRWDLDPRAVQVEFSAFRAPIWSLLNKTWREKGEK